MTLHWLTDPCSGGLFLGLETPKNPASDRQLLERAQEAISATVHMLRALKRRHATYQEFLDYVIYSCPYGWDRNRFIAMVRAMFHPYISWSLVDSITLLENSKERYTLGLPDGMQVVLAEDSHGTAVMHF